MKLLKNEQMTKGQKEFLGTEFTTDKGSVLTVVGVTNEKSSSAALFKVECSTCSKDEELFPSGFKSTKSHLVSGRFPCGCSRFPKWSEPQYKVRVKRKCAERDYELLGWSGKFKGTNTKLKLHNHRTSNTWNTTSINDFLSGGKGDPVEGSINSTNKQRKPLERVIYQLTTLCNKEDHTFLQLPIYKNGYSKFKWKCSEGHKCETRVNSFLRGDRCNICGDISRGNKQRKPIEQVINELTETCNKEGHTFKELPEYKNAFSKFKWVCSKGHECVTSINDFLNGGYRCKTCRDINNGIYGYYKNRTTQKDHLYVYTIKNKPFIKVGRSFEPDKRLKANQKRINDFYGNDDHQIEQVRLYTGNHLEVFKTEQYLLGNNVSYNQDGSIKDILEKATPFAKYILPLDKGYGSSELLKKESLDKVLQYLVSCEDLNEHSLT